MKYKSHIFSQKYNAFNNNKQKITISISINNQKDYSKALIFIIELYNKEKRSYSDQTNNINKGDQSNNKDLLYPQKYL